jgi:hypothetical protein
MPGDCPAWATRRLWLAAEVTQIISSAQVVVQTLGGQVSVLITHLAMAYRLVDAASEELMRPPP